MSNRPLSPRSVEVLREIATGDMPKVSIEPDIFKKLEDATLVERYDGEHPSRKGPQKRVRITQAGRVYLGALDKSLTEPKRRKKEKAHV